MKSLRRSPPKREALSEIESLASEHRQRVFWLLKETRKSHVEIIRCLLAMIITDGILVSGIALIPALLRAGSGFYSFAATPLFTLGEIVAVFLLVISLIIAIYGVAFISPPGPILTISGDALPRQQVVKTAQSDLSRLRQDEIRAWVAFRGAALFMLIALVPYLFTIFTLLP